MKYSISEAFLDKDRSKIVSLWGKNVENMFEKRYSWIYENNPSGPATCLLLKDINENIIVGAMALFPRRVLINGKYLKAGIVGDFLVDEKHRVFGPALSLQKSAISKCDGEKFHILYGFPNEKSEAILLRAGYKMLGEGLSLSKPLKAHYYLKRYLDIPIITKMLSYPIDLALKLPLKESYYKGNKELLVETPASFDHRFDVFWDKVSTQFPIIGERSSSYLNWRYFQSPHHEHHVFALTRKDNRDLLGYAISHVIDNRTVIDDILCLDMNETLNSLLSEFLLFQRKEGIDSVSIKYKGSQMFIKRLQEFGFYTRNKEWKFAFYTPPDSPLMKCLLNQESWYLVAGDNDI